MRQTGMNSALDSKHPTCEPELMAKSSRAWLREHVSDAYVKRASAEGMRSRAAYKLQQIAARDELLRPGTTVVDLGAAPGGWTQVAARAVAPNGRVIALDLLDMAPVAGATVIRADFREPAGVEALEEALGGRAADLVLSDMAPNLSGIGSVDQARSSALAEAALEFALEHLKPGGDFLVKLFHGAGYEAFVARVRQLFVRVHTRKPGASRSRSSEVYLVCKGLRRRRGGGAV
jgi:23S rRNA (uridine2552-2'-O)-methyltransferase